MSTWTLQKGFPVVTITQRQDGDNRVLLLTQEKFCSDGKLPKDEEATLWKIPITVSSASAPDKTIYSKIISEKSAELVIPGVPASDWIKLNVGTVGVYRVQYSNDHLAQFVEAIKNKTLPPLDRLGLQSDLFALVQAGRVPTIEAIKFMDAFVNENDFTVWSSIDDSLGKLNTLLSHTDFQENYRVWGRRLLAKIYDHLGWEARKGESHSDTLLRTVIIGRLIAFEDENVLSEARRRFDGHVNGTLVISADLRDVIYKAVAVGDSDGKGLERLFQIYRNTDLQEEKGRVMRAIGKVKDISRINEVLDFALSSEVRNQDSIFVIVSVAANAGIAQDCAWTFLKDNAATFKKRYEGGFILKSLVKYCTEGFASEEKVRNFTTFITMT